MSNHQSPEKKKVFLEKGTLISDSLNKKVGKSIPYTEKSHSLSLSLSLSLYIYIYIYIYMYVQG